MMQRPAQLKRPIPRTGELIPAVGLGTYQSFEVGKSEAGRAPLRDVLRSFVEAGGSVIDSSPMYGSAETVVGDLTADPGVRNSLFLATKVWTTGREAGIRQRESSFKRMRAAVIDLMQVRNLVDRKTHLETIRSWRQEGRVRYSGVTHYSTSAFGEMERVIKAERPDFIQICSSIATREAGLLPDQRVRERMATYFDTLGGMR